MCSIVNNSEFESNETLCIFCLESDNIVNFHDCEEEIRGKFETCLDLKFDHKTMTVCQKCIKTICEFDKFRLMCCKNFYKHHAEKSLVHDHFELKVKENMYEEIFAQLPDNEDSRSNDSASAKIESASTTDDQLYYDKSGSHRKKTSNFRQCQMCGKMVSDIKMHILTHTDTKNYKCDQCGKAFKQLGNLTSHLKIHSNVRDFKCDICCKDFVYKETLKKHMYTHTGERKYKCEYCEKAFTTTSGRLTHMKSHIQDRKHECSYCQKTFLLKYYLKKHLRIHTGEKPYKCNCCDKAFTSHWNLKTHLRTHSKEKPYKCEYCGKQFGRKNTYGEHIKIHAV